MVWFSFTGSKNNGKTMGGACACACACKQATKESRECGAGIKSIITRESNIREALLLCSTCAQTAVIYCCSSFQLSLLPYSRNDGREQKIGQQYITVPSISRDNDRETNHIYTERKSNAWDASPPAPAHCFLYPPQSSGFRHQQRTPGEIHVLLCITLQRQAKLFPCPRVASALTAPVERDKDGDLGERGQAAGQGVDVLRLVQLLDRLVSRFRVVGIPRLELLHLRS